MLKICHSLRCVVTQLMVVGLLLLGGMGVAMHAPSGTPGSARVALAAGQECPDDEERAFLAEINRYRKQKGRKPLRLEKQLMLAADYHSQDMTKMLTVESHTLSDGTSPHQNLINFGYPRKAAWGENLTFGITRDTAAAAFAAWKASSAHNRNMLRKDFRAIGIGHVFKVGSTYTHYWTTTFGGVVEISPNC